jgi:hypothetical protein
MSTITTTTQTQLPPWYSQFSQNLLGQAQAVAAEPYQAYEAPRVAGFTEDQLAAQEMVRQNIGSYAPLLGTGISGIIKAGGGSTFSSASPYAARAGRSAVTAANPYLRAGTSGSALTAAQPYFDQAASGSVFEAGQPFIESAAGQSALTAAQPYFERGAAGSSVAAAQPLLEQSAAGSAFAAAQPFMGAALERFPENVNAYMNPFIENVVRGISDLSQRNLSENLLPSVNRTFVGGGTFGGRRSEEFTGRALRDANEAALREQAGLLRQGYVDAANIFGADAARAMQGATLAGQLTEADLARQLTAGRTLGELTSADLSRQIQAGQSIGALREGDIARQISIGQALGALRGQDLSRIADIGARAGSLSGEDLSRQLTAGQIAGQLSSADLSRQVDLANIAAQAAARDAERELQAQKSLVDAAETFQRLQGVDAASLQGIGQQQQNLNQTSANLAYEDFLRQESYPMRMAEFLSGIGRGVSIPNTTVSTAPGPSRTASDIGAIAAGAGTVLDALDIGR